MSEDPRIFYPQGKKTRGSANDHYSVEHIYSSVVRWGGLAVLALIPTARKTKCPWARY